MPRLLTQVGSGYRANGTLNSQLLCVYIFFQVVFKLAVLNGVSNAPPNCLSNGSLNINAFLELFLLENFIF